MLKRMLAGVMSLCFVLSMSSRGLWDEELDRVWMYDGDAGIYFTEELDGIWQRFARFLYDGKRYWFNDTDPEEVYISSVNGVVYGLSFALHLL